jgi:hypothetical protein
MWRTRRPIWVGLAALACYSVVPAVLGGSIPADALPLPNRVAGADLIVVGRVTAFEDKNVLAAPFPGAKNKTEFKIAVVKISNALKAPQGATTIRLGFAPLPPGVAISPPPFQATPGQEGCFFLTRHGDGGFYVPSGQLSFLSRTNAGFDKDVALIKRCTTILENPDAALKGKNVDDRFLAAAMLVARFRTRRSAGATAEPVEAEQSKRILEALAAADWTPSTDFARLSPLMVLHRLPLTAKDGWSPPAGGDQKAYAAYAQQWLRDHAGTYRIQKFVAPKGE